MTGMMQCSVLLKVPGLQVCSPLQQQLYNLEQYALNKTFVCFSYYNIIYTTIRSNIFHAYTENILTKNN